MKINNLPTEYKNYVVARYCDDGWWYWGSYDALDKAYLTAEDVDVKSMNVRTSKQGTATIETGFIVHGREELSRVIKKLQQIEGIIEIERTTG